MKEVFVVMMYRWGEVKNHNYLLGVFEDRKKAVSAGNQEMLSRSNKYEPYIMKSELNGFKTSNLNYADTKILNTEFRDEKFFIKNFDEISLD